MNPGDCSLSREAVASDGGTAVAGDNGDISTKGGRDAGAKEAQGCVNGCALTN